MTITINKQSFAILGRGYNNENYDSGLSPEVTVTGITLTVPLTPFDKGDILSGLTVTATTSDSGTIDVTNYAHIDPFTNGDELTISGTITITAELYGFSDSGDITVTEPAVTVEDGISDLYGDFLSPDGNYLYSRSGDTLIIMELESKEIVNTITETGSIFNPLFKYGKRAFAKASNNTVYMFDETYNLLKTFTCADISEDQCCLSPDDQYVYIFKNQTSDSSATGSYRVNTDTSVTEPFTVNVTIDQFYSNNTYSKAFFISETKIICKTYFYASGWYDTWGESILTMEWNDATSQFDCSTDFGTRIDLTTGGWHWGDTYCDYAQFMYYQPTNKGVFTVDWGDNNMYERHMDTVNAYSKTASGVSQTARGLTGDSNPYALNVANWDKCIKSYQSMDQDYVIAIMAYYNNGSTRYDLVLIHINDHVTVYRTDITAEYEADTLISGSRIYSPTSGIWHKFLFN